MKKKILSKIFTRKNKNGKRSETYQFGDDIVIDFDNYYKISFFIRKRLEFKKKDFGKKLIIKYYSNTIDPENAHLVFNYTTRKKPKTRSLKYDFEFNNGTHTLEFKVPVDIVQLNSIEIYMTMHDNNDGRYIIRFEDIHFKD